jgi:hypothetical protein
MGRFLVAFIPAVMLFSCDRTETDGSKVVVKVDTAPKAEPISLSGQLYFYAPELDTVSCTSTGACDCCSGEILFLNDSSFVLVDHCVLDADYSKGKYRFVDNNLILTSDSICISKQFNWEKETDTTGKVLVDYFVTDTLLATTTQTLKVEFCKGTPYFLMGDKERYFVTPYKNKKISDVVSTLKEQKIWDRLDIKNYR